MQAHASHGLDDRPAAPAAGSNPADRDGQPPVGIRWMRPGPAAAPRSPPTPAAVETSPICAAGTPSCDHPQHDHEEDRVGDQVGQRRPDQQRPEERPRPHEAGSPRRAAGAAARGRPVRRGEVGAHPADGHAGDREGDRVHGERQPPRDGVQRTPERPAEQRGDVLAGLVLAEGGRQVLGGTTDRIAEISAGLKAPAATPADQRDHDQVGERERCRRPGDRERGVGRAAGAAGRRASSAAGRCGRRARRRAAAWRSRPTEVGGLDQAAASAEPLRA